MFKTQFNVIFTSFAGKGLLRKVGEKVFVIAIVFSWKLICDMSSPFGEEIREL